MWDNSARKRLYLLILCYIAGLSAAVAIFVAGHLRGTRVFPIVILLLMVGFSVILSLFFYKVNARNRLAAEVSGGSIDALTRERLRRTIRNLKIYVVILLLALLYGLWETRGAPLAPRLVGAAINLLLTTYLVVAIRQTQKRLQQP